MKNKTYHYTECGLNNIHLINGFKINKLQDGNEEIFIQDINGLHRAIGNSLIFKAGLLSGDEIKFIRTTLDFSQKTLASLLGLDYQSILAYEKNKTSISKTADHFLRVIFYSHLNKDPEIYNKIKEIADLDAELVKNTRQEQMEFYEGEWRIAA